MQLWQSVLPRLTVTRMTRSSIRQVAERAGVSTMTVSRVLRGEGESQHQERVLAAARDLDYVPVRSSLQNRHVKTNIIGVLLDDEFTFDRTVGFQTFGGLARATFAESYDLLLLQPQHLKPLEKQKMQFLDRRCDGFIFVVPYERPEILELLIEHQFPAVTCYSTDVPEGVAWVVPDNESAVRQAVCLLRGQGHRHIAFLSAGQRHSDARERSAAYHQAMNEANLPTFSCKFLERGQNDCLSQREMIANLRQNRVTAVICHNDERAFALWDAALEQGLNVPRDLSIIGIDDVPAAASRGLTTFANPFGEIGRTALQSLHSILQGAAIQPNCKRIPMTLVERSSVARPREFS